MSFLSFKQQFFDLACFGIDQVYAWNPGFDRNNLSRWVKRGYLLRLRQGWYSFPEYLKQPGFALYVANQIYRPSYISLHTALSYHGLIPEAVVQITSITTLKTWDCENAFAQFTFKSMKPSMMLGYMLINLSDGRVFRMALPEKALLDLLYLYPEYDTSYEIINLRLDEEYMKNTFDWQMFWKYGNQAGNKTLKERIRKLETMYM